MNRRLKLKTEKTENWKPKTEKTETEKTETEKTETEKTENRKNWKNQPLRAPSLVNKDGPVTRWPIQYRRRARTRSRVHDGPLA